MISSAEDPTYMEKHYELYEKSPNPLTLISILLVGLFFLGFFISGCSTMSNLPKAENVKVSREKPGEDDKCEDLGKVTGSSIHATASAEDTLKDLVQEAANKGANFLFVSQYSANNTAATGIAYKCP